MNNQTSTNNQAKTFYDIPTAAELAGYASRHFRRIIEEDSIPVLKIGSKVYIGARDFEVWKSTRGEVRFDAAIHQLDGWLRDDAARTSVFEPVLESLSAEADF